MSIEYESSVSTGLHKETVQARVNYAGLITLNVEGFGVNQLLYICRRYLIGAGSGRSWI
jgi:hypothetical protein